MEDIMLTNSKNTTNDSHVLVIGSGRSGKTHYFIKPNLLKITDSVVVIGRKNDNLEDTADHRRKLLKQQIYDISNYDQAVLNKVNNNTSFTVYLLASVLDKEELADISNAANILLTAIALSKEKVNPVTVIIDDISLFDIDVNILFGYLNQGLVNDLRVIITVQAIYQLKQKYGQESAQTILDNCKNKVILRVNDPDDAKYISNLSNGVFSPEEILQNMNCAFFIKDKKFQKKSLIIRI
jgi:type IV secretory pathway TraG/TraD family ATPase VirD4